MKEDRDFLTDCLIPIYSKFPPQKDKPQNTVMAFKEFIDVSKPPPLDKIIWAQWVKIYTSSSTPRQILKALLRGKPGRIFEIILPKERKTKDPFKYLREANEIFFGPDSLLKRFNIDMPSGSFTLYLIFYLKRDKTMIGWMERRPCSEADKKLKRLLRHCLGILLSIENEFFKRFEKGKRSHLKAVDILFGGYRSYSKTGKRIIERTLDREINEVKKMLSEKREPKFGKSYEDSLFFYIAHLMAIIGRWRGLPRSRGALLSQESLPPKSPPAWGIMRVRNKKDSSSSIDVMRVFKLF